MGYIRMRPGLHANSNGHTEPPGKHGLFPNGRLKLMLLTRPLLLGMHGPLQFQLSAKDAR